MHQPRDCIQVKNRSILKVKKLNNQAKIPVNAQSITRGLEAAALGSSWSKAPAPFSPVPQFPLEKALAARREPPIHPPRGTQVQLLPPPEVGSEMCPSHLLCLQPLPGGQAMLLPEEGQVSAIRRHEKRGKKIQTK